MRQVYRRPYQQRGSARKNVIKQKLKLGGIIIVGAFVAVNVLLLLVFSNRTYPRTKIVDTTIGSVAYKDIASKTDKLKVLPEKLTMQYQDKRVAVRLQDLGISKDTARTEESAKEQKHWLPIVNLFKTPRLEAPITIDASKLGPKAAELATTFQAEPANARLQINGTTVDVVKEKTGYKLKTDAIDNAIYTALDDGESLFKAPVTTKPPQVKSGSLTAAKQSLQKSIDTAVTLKFSAKTKQVAKSDIAKWYVVQDNAYVVSPDAVRAYAVTTGTEFGIMVKDTDQVVTAITQALKDHKASTVTLTKQVALKTFSYCVNVRGVSTDNLPLLRTMLASTYADSRGWSIKGLVGFKYVTSGCDYTVWLSSAALMPSFGGVCDSEWSCRSGDNVVINYDRWANASPAWNKMGGTIQEYRNMVINHESGHWLGFGHDHCGGAGQLAPVMQQQSINLQGCKFSPWPNATELATLKSRLGL